MTTTRTALHELRTTMRETAPEHGGFDVEADCRCTGWHWIGWAATTVGAASDAALAWSEHLLRTDAR